MKRMTIISVACAAILSFDGLMTPSTAATAEAIRVGNLIYRYNNECEVPIGNLAVFRARHPRASYEDFLPQPGRQDATYRVKRTAACEQLARELKKLRNCPLPDDYGSWNPDC